MSTCFHPSCSQGLNEANFQRAAGPAMKKLVEDVDADTPHPELQKLRGEDASLCD